jgi:hypothetical protein
LNSPTPAVGLDHPAGTVTAIPGMKALSPNITQVPAVRTQGDLSEQRAVKGCEVAALRAEEAVGIGVTVTNDEAGSGVDVASEGRPAAQAPTRSVAAIKTPASSSLRLTSTNRTDPVLIVASSISISVSESLDGAASIRRPDRMDPLVPDDSLGQDGVRNGRGADDGSDPGGRDGRRAAGGARG